MGREMGVPVPTCRAPKTAEARAYTRWLHGASQESVAKEMRASTFVTSAENTPTIGYSAGDNLGFVVPMQYHSDIVEGMKLTDPLLDADIVTLVQKPDYALRPFQLPGWDLTTVAAVKVGENVQESAATIPTLNQPLLNKFGYR